MGLTYAKVESWMTPVAMYWSSTALTCLARMKLIRSGWKTTVALSDGRRVLNIIREHEPKSVVDVGKTSGNS